MSGLINILIAVVNYRALGISHVLFYIILFIFVISPNTTHSYFVLCELQANWKKISGKREENQE